MSRDAATMPVTLAPMALWLLALNFAAAPAGAATDGRSLKARCFAAAELRQRAGEQSIRHTQTDPLPAPGEPVSPADPVPQGLRGSIRRVQLPQGLKLVALTFDLCENAGELSGYDGAIFDTLREQNAKATFFASGKWLLDHRERAAQVLSDPLFEVGGHSFTHRNFRLLPETEVRADLTLDLHADAELRQAARAKACWRDAASGENRGSARLSLFRFPFGTCNAQSMQTVNGMGMAAIQWDVVSGDPSPKQSAEAIERGVVDAAKPGSIVVMHANGRGWHTAEALPNIITALRRRGFEFATVSELLSRGRPVIADTCYENKPGDNEKYDKLFPIGSPSAKPASIR